MRNNYSQQEQNINLSSVIFSSVEQLPDARSSVAFTVDSSQVFREYVDMVPVRLSDSLSYMPWGADNQMPYGVLDLIEKDETLSTCQMFNTEICYGNGLQYNTDACTAAVREQVEDFLLANNLASYFLGVCQDFKHFGWAVSVIILDKEGKHIVGLHRKEACYCRFSPANKHGVIENVLYANWKKSVSSLDDVEVIALLNTESPWNDLQARMEKHTHLRKFAMVSRVPTPDSTYYPIPYYASLFRGKWYNIKQLIGMAKEAKLKNSAPIKYHIEVSERYWTNIFSRLQKPIDIKCWTKSGAILELTNAIPLRYNFYEGTQQFKILNSREIRTVRVNLIFEINKIEVFL